MSSRFLFRIRTQFTFVAKDEAVSCVLRGIAQNKVNINGYELTKGVKSAYNQVRLVVGVTAYETARDLRVVRNVLRSQGIKYQTKQLLQIYGFPAETPGILNTLFNALRCKTRVIATYFSEKSKIYIDVANLPAAIRVLAQSPLPACPQKCK